MRKGRVLVSLPHGMEHCGSIKAIIIGMTVIISLMVRLKPSNGQGD
jgi:hypothetical protein